MIKKLIKIVETIAERCFETIYLKKDQSPPCAIIAIISVYVYMIVWR